MGAWIEIKAIRDHVEEEESHPTMGAWIEISLRRVRKNQIRYVAPHDGCVD